MFYKAAMAKTKCTNQKEILSQFFSAPNRLKTSGQGNSKSNIHRRALPPCRFKPEVHIKMDLFVFSCLFLIKTAAVNMVCN